MAVKPILRYTGSKHKLAPKIIDLLGEHRGYVEPYVGSAAVLLRKDPARVEVINDANDLLIAFYRLLRDTDTRARLIDAITFTPYSRAEREACNVDHDDLDPIERARRFFVRSNQSFSGDPNAGWTCTRRASSGHSNGSQWGYFWERLEAVALRLRSVQIESTDALAVLRPYADRPDPDTVIYADPPYLASTRNGSRFFVEADDSHHEALLEVLLRLEEMRVVVSAYDSDLYDRYLLAGGWSRYVVKQAASSRSGEGSIASRSEVLWASPKCSTPEWGVST